MEHIKTIETRNLCDSAKTAAAVNARPPASLPARPAAELQTRSVRAQSRASNCIAEMPPITAAFFRKGEIIYDTSI